MKQMKAYSQAGQWNINYVAMFNWDWLFLCIFNDDVDIFHGSLLPRNGMQRNELRKAFLGWLLEAYANDG